MIIIMLMMMTHDVVDDGVENNGMIVGIHDDVEDVEAK